MNGRFRCLSLISRVRIFRVACCVLLVGLLSLYGDRSFVATPIMASSPLSDNGGANIGASGSVSKSELHVDGAAPNTAVSFALDDGTAEDSYGWGLASANTSCSAIWLNRFTPASNLVYPLTVTSIRIPWLSQNPGSLNGRPIKLLIYTDSDNDGNPANARLIHQSDQTMHVYSPSAFDNYTVSVVLDAPGDFYVGWEDAWARSAPSPFMYPAAVDTNSASQHRSYIAANASNCTPNISNLGGNERLSLLDNLAGVSPGNLLIRVSGNDAIRCASERYTDVCPGDYYYTPALYLSNLGAISGYSDRTFRPFNNTTRAQLCKIITIAKGWAINTAGGPHFSDVPTSDTFYNYIETAYNHNIITGYAGRLFKPGDAVSRAQICKIIVVAQGWPINTAGGPHFTDVPSTNVFYNYVETAVNRGIISGYSNRTFEPGSDVTRGQLSKILYTALVP